MMGFRGSTTVRVCVYVSELGGLPNKGIATASTGEVLPWHGII